mmetsp:Transcript_14841/g.41127  ORF Transcript_14841/g.41127 Transcript_14841/m.41127 type:complete len:110 (-) Transcript_14841:152-481(-)
MGNGITKQTATNQDRRDTKRKEGKVKQDKTRQRRDDDMLTTTHCMHGVQQSTIPYHTIQPRLQLNPIQLSLTHLHWIRFYYSIQFNWSLELCLRHQYEYSHKLKLKRKR